MAITVNNTMVHAISFIKGPSTYATAEELRFANTIQSIISGYYRWHWLLTAGQNVSISASTQDYTLNASDQNKVMDIYEAHLLSGSTELPELVINSDSGLPISSTTGRPYGIALISPTQVRLWPVPDATYTLKWRYYTRPTIFTANSDNWQIPEAFSETAKAGMVWQVLSYADDDRADGWKATFYELLKNHKQVELTTSGRMRG